MIPTARMLPREGVSHWEDKGPAQCADPLAAEISALILGFARVEEVRLVPPLGLPGLLGCPHGEVDEDPVEPQGSDQRLRGLLDRAVLPPDRGEAHVHVLLRHLRTERPLLHGAGPDVDLRLLAVVVPQVE